MITLVIISNIEVAQYYYFTNPGHEFIVYEAFAEYSASFILGIFRFIIFFLVARHCKKKRISEFIQTCPSFSLHLSIVRLFMY